MLLPSRSGGTCGASRPSGFFESLRSHRRGSSPGPGPGLWTFPGPACSAARLGSDRSAASSWGEWVLLQIKPALCQVWRDTETLQIGLDPGRGTLLSGLGPLDRLVVHQLSCGLDTDLLPSATPAVPDPLDCPNPSDSPNPLSDRPARGPGDGGGCVRNTRRPVRVRGGVWDRQTHRTRQMIGLLSEAGVLVTSRTPRSVLARFGTCRDRLAPDAALWSVVYPLVDDGWDLLAARSHRCVRVIGAGRTGAALVGLLAAAGVGRLLVSDATPVTPQDLAPAGAGPQDVGDPRSHAAARAALRPLLDLPHTSGSGTGAPVPGPEPFAGRDEQVDLVVTVEHDVVDAIRAKGFERVPHLPVLTGPTGTVLGPLVLPERGPCLRCLDLHRSDRDPRWPRVLAELLSRRRVEQRAGAPEETVLSALAAALAALQVLAFLDGCVAPPCLGATLEIEAPHGLISRRPWPAHPSCDCQAGTVTSGNRTNASGRRSGIRAGGR
ncbi:MAG: hypothetical protein QG608_2338 [Actinomycetota bacterium]|nr:hypothetical protein [Actinomycetota bacterium]